MSLIEIIVVGTLRTNCYIVADGEDRDCVLIDPGDNAKRLLDFLEERKLTCRAVLITHGHPDHVGAVRRILADTNALLYVNDIDSKCSTGWGPRPFVLPEHYCQVTDGMEITVGNLVFQAVACPGHSPGGMAYVWKNNIFTGDTLFRGTCGRCDIPHADPLELKKSLQKLMEYPDHYKIFPGHGKISDIGTEKNKVKAFRELP